MVISELRGDREVLCIKNGKVKIADAANFIVDVLLSTGTYRYEWERNAQKSVLKKQVLSGITYGYKQGNFDNALYNIENKEDAALFLPWACRRWPALEAVPGMQPYRIKNARSSKVGGMVLGATASITPGTYEDAKRRLHEYEKRIRELERENAMYRELLDRSAKRSSDGKMGGRPRK
jgi:hypothetical protein